MSLQRLFLYPWFEQCPSTRSCRQGVGAETLPLRQCVHGNVDTVCGPNIRGLGCVSSVHIWFTWTLVCSCASMCSCTHFRFPGSCKTPWLPHTRTRARSPGSGSKCPSFTSCSSSSSRSSLWTSSSPWSLSRSTNWARLSSRMTWTRTKSPASTLPSRYVPTIGPWSRSKGIKVKLFQAKPLELYVPEEQSGIRYHIWRLVTSAPFENFIMLLIVCNTILLMLKVNQFKTPSQSLDVEICLFFSSMVPPGISPRYWAISTGYLRYCSQWRPPSSYCHLVPRWVEIIKRVKFQTHFLYIFIYAHHFFCPSVLSSSFSSLPTYFKSVVDLCYLRRVTTIL